MRRKLEDIGFWVALIGILVLIFGGVSLDQCRGADLFMQTCEENSMLIVTSADVDPEWGLTALSVIRDCIVHYGEPAKICQLEPGLYITSYWDDRTGDLMFWEPLHITNENGKYFSILNCGEDL